MQTKSRIVRICKNLAYILGSYIGKITGLTTLQLVIQAFLEGWLDVRV